MAEKTRILKIAIPITAIVLFVIFLLLFCSKREEQGGESIVNTEPDISVSSQQIQSSPANAGSGNINIDNTGNLSSQDVPEIDRQSVFYELQPGTNLPNIEFQENDNIAVLPDDYLQSYDDIDFQIFPDAQDSIESPYLQTDYIASSNITDNEEMQREYPANDFPFNVLREFSTFDNEDQTPDTVIADNTPETPPQTDFFDFLPDTVRNSDSFIASIQNVIPNTAVVPPPVEPPPVEQPPAAVQPPVIVPPPANLNMQILSGGTFIMGSPVDEEDRGEGEIQHRVTLRPFFIGKYEVTQSEYSAIMGTNPSYFKGGDLPVDNVSWFDAIEYCNRLSSRHNLTPAYSITGIGSSRVITWNPNAGGYRLPTEEEWEYACRAGTATIYNTGDRIQRSMANYFSSGPVKIGSYAPNAWGLYDMHGNVSEWCWDIYRGSSISLVQEYTVPVNSEEHRVFRGGSWFNTTLRLRSAFRDHIYPSHKSQTIGFRIVRNAY